MMAFSHGLAVDWNDARTAPVMENIQMRMIKLIKKQIIKKQHIKHCLRYTEKGTYLFLNTQHM